MHCQSENTQQWLCATHLHELGNALQDLSSRRGWGQTMIGFSLVRFVGLCGLAFLAVHIIMSALLWHHLKRWDLGSISLALTVVFFMLGVRLGRSGWRTLVRLMFLQASTTQLRWSARAIRLIRLLLREGNLLIIAPFSLLLFAGAFVVLLIWGPPGPFQLVLALSGIAVIFGHFYSWFYYGDWIKALGRHVEQVPHGSLSAAR